MEKFSLFKHSDQIEDSLLFEVKEVYLKIINKINSITGFLPDPEYNEFLTIEQCSHLIGLRDFIEDCKLSNSRVSRITPYAFEFLEIENFCFNIIPGHKSLIENHRSKILEAFLKELSSGINLKIFGDKIKYNEIVKRLLPTERCSMAYLNHFDPRDEAAKIKYEVIGEYTALPEILKECEGRAISLADLKQVSNEIFELVSDDFISEILDFSSGLRPEIKDGKFLAEVCGDTSFGSKLPRNYVLFSEGSVLSNSLKLQEGERIMSKRFDKMIHLDKVLDVTPVKHEMKKDIYFGGQISKAKFQGVLLQKRGLGKL